MSAHTRSPWHIGGKPTHPIVYGPDGFVVADATVFHGTFKENETTANAALIASAPELLAALREVFADYGAVNRLSWVQAAGNAIAKAEICL